MRYFWPTISHVVVLLMLIFSPFYKSAAQVPKNTTPDRFESVAPRYDDAINRLIQTSPNTPAYNLIKKDLRILEGKLLGLYPNQYKINKDCNAFIYYDRTALVNSGYSQAQIDAYVKLMADTIHQRITSCKKAVVTPNVIWNTPNRNAIYETLAPIEARAPGANFTKTQMDILGLQDSIIRKDKSILLNVLKHEVAHCVHNQQCPSGIYLDRHISEGLATLEEDPEDQLVRLREALAFGDISKKHQQYSLGSFLTAPPHLIFRMDPPFPYNIAHAYTRFALHKIKIKFKLENEEDIRLKYYEYLGKIQTYNEDVQRRGEEYSKSNQPLNNIVRAYLGNSISNLEGEYLLWLPDEIDDARRI